MADVNMVILIGHLGSDPEVRHTASGTSVANFTLATNERWIDSSGERQEKTEWHRVVVWAKQAEIVGQYLRKGRQVYVEGSLRTREWTDREDNKHSTTEVRARRVEMLDRREQGKVSAKVAKTGDAEPSAESNDEGQF